MKEWFMYALIAAIFIGVKDLMTKDTLHLKKKKQKKEI